MNTESATLPPAVLAAAETLAATLTRAAPIADYHHVRARLDADLDSRELLQRFSEAQADLRVRQARGVVTQLDIDGLRVLQRQVQSNRLILDYARAQQAAIAYLSQVNREISELLGLDFGAMAGPASC